MTIDDRRSEPGDRATEDLLRSVAPAPLPLDLEVGLRDRLAALEADAAGRRSGDPRGGWLRQAATIAMASGLVGLAGGFVLGRAISTDTTPPALPVVAAPRDTPPADSPVEESSRRRARAADASRQDLPSLSTYRSMLARGTDGVEDLDVGPARTRSSPGMPPTSRVVADGWPDVLAR